METRTEKVLIEAGSALDGSGASTGFRVPRLAAVDLPAAWQTITSA
ncbi:MAG: hypothetical protein ACYC6L_04765 [Anaerolineae bacterium]